MDRNWKLQDIRPAEPRKRRAPSDRQPLQKMAPPEEVFTEENDGTVRIEVEDGRSKSRLGIFIAIGVFFVVIAGGFIASFMLGGAELTVYPRNREPNINAVFTAYASPKVGELSYEIMSLEADGERQVSATGQEEVRELATGRITIYNETESAERLKKNTRFETPDGLIFKITESAVVPGAQKNASGELIPGSVQAEVFSDEPGEQYNIRANTRLTIPGYKEGGFDELYNSLYARNSENFTNGFDGLKFIIDDLELATEKQRLQTQLRDALLDRIPGERPAGFVVFDDAVTFTYQSLPAVEYGENLATIKEKALLQIPIFKEEDFATYIAAATIPGYEGEPVRIEDFTALTFSYTQATTSSTNIGAVDSVSFNLTGRPLVVWEYDEGKLKTDLFGSAKTALQTILSGYPAIERAEAVIRPFWQRSFPESLDDIEIIEVITNTKDE